jgi:hypothetical protein
MSKSVAVHTVANTGFTTCSADKICSHMLNRSLKIARASVLGSKSERCDSLDDDVV